MYMYIYIYNIYMYNIYIYIYIIYLNSPVFQGTYLQRKSRAMSPA